MAEFKKKTNENFWHSPLVLAVIFCIVVVFMYNMVGIIEKDRETAKKKDQIVEKTQEMNAREGELKNQIATLETEQGSETAIREKYQVVKEGEKMLVIVDEDQSAENNEKTVSSGTFWTWLKNLFK